MPYLIIRSTFYVQNKDMPIKSTNNAENTTDKYTYAHKQKQHITMLTI